MEATVGLAHMTSKVDPARRSRTTEEVTMISNVAFFGGKGKDLSGKELSIDTSNSCATQRMAGLSLTCAVLF